MIKLTALWVNKNPAGQTTTSNAQDLNLVKNNDPSQKGDFILSIGGQIVGRLWTGKKLDKNGNPYLSGFFLDARCVVFKNDQKGNDKAPAYRVMIAENTEQQQKPVEPEHPVTAGLADDDLPF